MATQVFIEGNIACGKTNFLTVFGKSSFFDTIAEPIHAWRTIGGRYNALDLMYSDPKRWSFTFQNYVQLTLLHHHNVPSRKRAIVGERSLYSARHIFVENLFKNKNLDPMEYCILDEFYQHFLGLCPIDLILYLRSSPEVCLERLRKRARPEEKSVSLELLQTLHNNHEKWINSANTSSSDFPLPLSKVITINGNPSLDEMIPTFEQIREEIVSALQPPPDRSPSDKQHYQH